MKRTFFGEMWARLKAETPSFFKKLMVFGGSLASLGAALVIIPNVPARITDITTDFIWIGSVIVAVCKMVVVNPDEIKK